MHESGPYPSGGATSPARAGVAVPSNNSVQPRLSGRRVTPGASLRFIAATEWLDDGTPVVSVKGEVDLATAPALEQTLLAVDGDGAVIVDLTDCSFFDSTGLKLLVAAQLRLERANRRLALVVATSNVLRVFELTRLDELFAIYPSLAAAHANHE